MSARHPLGRKESVGAFIMIDVGFGRSSIGAIDLCLVVVIDGMREMANIGCNSEVS
jgi:hypothetical protein